MRGPLGRIKLHHQAAPSDARFGQLGVVFLHLRPFVERVYLGQSRLKQTFLGERVNLFPGCFVGLGQGSGL